MSDTRSVVLFEEVHKDIVLMNMSIQGTAEYYKRKLSTARMDLKRITENPARWKRIYDVENRSYYKNRSDGTSIYDEFVCRNMRIIGDFVIKYAYTQFLLEDL